MSTLVVSGRERKVYTPTDAGERAYQVASQAWGEMADYIIKAIKNSYPGLMLLELFERKF